jgi:hypothetical protein
MEAWEYFVISSYIFPIGTGLALFIQKRLPVVGGLLWGYLLVTFCIEIAAVILANNEINNLWLYRIYLYIELAFPTIFFYNQFSKIRSKVLLLSVFSASIILTTLTNVFDDWQARASIQTGITFGCVALIIISYFVEMFRTEKVFYPFKEVYFIVGAVLLLGHSCTLIYNVLFDYLIKGYFGSEINSILNGVNLGLIVFYNVLYSYALWISKRHLI